MTGPDQGLPKKPRELSQPITSSNGTMKARKICRRTSLSGGVGEGLEGGLEGGIGRGNGH